MAVCAHVLNFMLRDFGIPSKLFEAPSLGYVLDGYVLNNVLPSPGWGMSVNVFSSATNLIVS